MKKKFECIPGNAPAQQPEQAGVAGDLSPEEKAEVEAQIALDYPPQLDAGKPSALAIRHDDRQRRDRRRRLQRERAFSRWLGPLGSRRRYFTLMEIAQTLEQLPGREDPAVTVNDLVAATVDGNLTGGAADRQAPMLILGHRHGIGPFTPGDLKAAMAVYSRDEIMALYISKLYLRSDLARAWLDQHQLPALGYMAKPKDDDLAKSTRRTKVSTPRRSKRKSEGDAALAENRFRAVHAAARSWCKELPRQTTPDYAPLARELARSRRDLGFRAGTIRQILNDTYPPAKRFHIGKFVWPVPKERD
jgi:hypothetical protein